MTFTITNCIEYICVRACMFLYMYTETLAHITLQPYYCAVILIKENLF